MDRSTGSPRKRSKRSGRNSWRKAKDPYHQIAIPRATGIKINSIREIRREAPLTSASQKRRMFILSNADMLTDVAAHTLLKTLEEPPAHCMLILTTSYRDELLPTILSRCQQVRFDPLSDVQIQEGLVERDGVEAESRHTACPSVRRELYPCA